MHSLRSKRPGTAEPGDRGLRHRGVCVAGWLGLPGTVPAPAYLSIRYWQRPVRPPRNLPERAPVLLVHGYAGTEHMWGPLRSALADAGFEQLIALRYNPFRSDIHQIADWLVDQARRSMSVSSAGRVHLVGHSMGGLVIRDAIVSRGLGAAARTAVTLATPHGGTPLARFVPGPCARQMRPGAPFLAELARRSGNGRTRWVDISGGADLVVPARTAVRHLSAQDALVTRQQAVGHRSIAHHPDVIALVVSELLKSEQTAAQDFSLAA